jgi:SOS response regulatory protein OraA/RecX
LYALQKSLGHEPQIEIDSHANHSIQLLSQDKEHQGAIKTRALYLADDLLNSSARVQAQLRASMTGAHPKTLKLVEEIVKSAHEYNLLDHNQNLELARRIVKKLALDGVWHEIDEVKNLISMVKEL